MNITYWYWSVHMGDGPVACGYMGDEPVGEYLKRAHHLSSDLLFSSILFYSILFHSISFHSIPFHSNSIDQDSRITAEAKRQHVLHVPTTYRYRRTQTILQWVSSTLMLNNIIHCKYTPPPSHWYSVFHFSNSKFQICLLWSFMHYNTSLQIVFT